MTQLDNFTDGIMIGKASFPRQSSVMVDIMNINGPEYKDQNPVESINSYLKDENGLIIDTYPRYWHGYITFLRPLLIFWDLSDIRLFNLLLHALSQIIIILLFAKRKLFRQAFFYQVGLLYLSPWSIAFSLQYSSVYYIFQFSVMAILFFYESLSEKNLFAYLFFLIGILTSYFDLLTYPVATFGFPFATLIILDHYLSKSKSIFSYIYDFFFWISGYATFWASKWILSSIFLDENIILDAFESISTRSSNFKGDQILSYMDVFAKNISLYFNKPILIFTIALVFLSLYLIFKSKPRPQVTFQDMIPFILLMLLPALWYLGARNHSYIHSWFTYRSLSLSITSLFFMLSILIK